MAERLLEKLKSYSESDFYPLHMPGHKRRVSHFGDPFAIDITEIDGFDNLHHAQGVLLAAQERAAKLYGAQETYYLINGSTCGILAAVSASVKRGERILMARNCHKAVYHAVLLNGLHASYLYPPMDLTRGISGGITPESVREALAAQPDIRAVIVTSPTYDGVSSDIRKIAEEVHRAGAVLIVDEAHGAHFPMHEYFPESALAQGADIVINSLHKTMPSLTQTALLHVQGERADRGKLRRYLGIYQSSSPSYVLMAGMDACVGWMEEQGKERFALFVKRLEEMRGKLSTMKTLHLVDGSEESLGAFDYDKSNVLISTEACAMSGPELAQLLREAYHLEAEMEAAQYVTAIMTVCDTQEGFDRLTAALLEIDGRLCEDDGGIRCEKSRRTEIGADTIMEDVGSNGIKSDPAVSSDKKNPVSLQLWKNEEALTVEAAEEQEAKPVLLRESAGEISAEFVYLYPPGIPLLVPGERISEDLLAQLDYYQALGMELQGLADYSGETIRIVCGDI